MLIDVVSGTPHTRGLRPWGKIQIGSMRALSPPHQILLLLLLLLLYRPTVVEPWFGLLSNRERVWEGG